MSSDLASLSDCIDSRVFLPGLPCLQLQTKEPLIAAPETHPSPRARVTHVLACLVPLYLVRGTCRPTIQPRSPLAEVQPTCHVEAMHPDEILDRSAQFEKIDTIARGTFGLNEAAPSQGSLSLNILTNHSLVQVKESLPTDPSPAD
jgi:hypothetical protein